MTDSPPTGPDRHAEACGMAAPQLAAVTETTAAIIVATQIGMLAKITAGSLFHGVVHHDFDENAVRAQLGALCDVLEHVEVMIEMAPSPGPPLDDLDRFATTTLGRLAHTIASIGTELAFTAEIPDDFHDRIDQHVHDLQTINDQVSAAIVLAARSAGN